MARYGLPPEEIEARSFAIIEDLLPPGGWDAEERRVAVRMIHAAGDPSLAGDLRFSPGAVACGVAALRAGRPVFADVRMLAAGISAPLAGRLGSTVRCLMDVPGVGERAAREGTTRAAAAVRLSAPDLAGAVVAVGNAPTALLALLDLLDAGLPPPALVVGTPVGFVSAAESKRELLRRPVPHVTVLGTRGGSPLAAAAVNALLRLAEAGGRAADGWGESGCPTGS